MDTQVSTRLRTRMPSRVDWPVMGGPTAHPTGVTLASGDPPSSLNVSEGSLDCSHLPEAAPGLVLSGSRELVPSLVGAVSTGGRSERGSETQSGPLRRIGSSGEASCPAVGVVAENRVPHPYNPDTGGRQEGMEVAEW